MSVLEDFVHENARDSPRRPVQILSKYFDLLLNANELNVLSTFYQIEFELSFVRRKFAHFVWTHLFSRVYLL